jgi:hypothetical protein
MSNKKSASLKQKLTKMRYINLVAFIAVFAAIAGSVVLFSSQAAPKNRGGGSNSTVPTISITPSSQKNISPTNTLTLGIWEDSQSTPVNAVQANLTYDAKVFDFVNIDAAVSAFEIQAQAFGSNGTINIARGHVGNLTGKQLIAYITLKPKLSNVKSSRVDFAGDTILTSSTGTDVIKSKIGGIYSIGR